MQHTVNRPVSCFITCKVKVITVCVNSRLLLRSMLFARTLLTLKEIKSLGLINERFVNICVHFEFTNVLINVRFNCKLFVC